ncbi:MAG: ATP-binding protein [Deltaproteobacteria bacterium]|nr:ATP-binding protein [Myxococcales bacterium]MDP3212779.1 ATP-binding protein [Deltaproteobacteria bacterium]
MAEPDERVALRDFWEVLEATRAEVEAAVEAAAAKVPSMAALMASMSPETREAQRRLSLAQQRAVLLEGRWDEYLADLRQQGAAYAQMGIEFRDWFGLLGTYRSNVRRHVLPDLDARRVGILWGMDRFTGVAMAEIGESYIAMKEDIVRRAEAEVARFVDLFQNASMGMVIWHLDEPGDPGSFRLVTANPAAARVSGTELLGAVGRQVRELPGDSRAPYLDLWLATLADRAPRSWTAVQGDDPETRRSFAAQCFALREDHLGVLFEDVTERQRMAARLDHHVRELERSNRELDDFAYVTSHDLKSPLRDVRNLVSWITEDVGATLPPTSAQHLKLVNDRVQRMEQLLDDLLEYSRVGRTVDESRPFTLREVLDSVLALQAPPEGFTVALEGDDYTLCTPRMPFEKVLRNLIGNALKHHDRAEGRVVVRADAAGDDRIEVRVTDDGPGIRQEFHERVFRVFQTLRPRDEVEGSGVGLAIVKKTVELFGGRARVESEGRGTAVVFTWPLRWAVTGA